MVQDDTAYFQRRAEVQLALAERATLPGVVSAHCQLANAYLDRLTAQEPVELGQTAGGR